MVDWERHRGNREASGGPRVDDKRLARLANEVLEEHTCYLVTLRAEVSNG